MSTLRLGEGDEYELPADLELIVTDPKVVTWRKQQFVTLGFSMGEADMLAKYRSADLHDIAGWLKNGCTHAQALEIAAPVDLIVVPVKVEPAHLPEYGAEDASVCPYCTDGKFKSGNECGVCKGTGKAT